jgi:hypothetical protein
VACLHCDFEQRLTGLLSIWRKKNHLKVHAFDFYPNPFSCEEDIHSNLNALYYSRRGHFFLTRQNPELAFKYMQEAIHQHWNSPLMRNNYALSIIALRNKRRAQGLDRDLDNPGPYRPPPRHSYQQDDDTMFRYAFLWMIDQKDIDIPALEQRLVEMQRPFMQGSGRLRDDGMANEWCFEKAVGHTVGPQEMESQVQEALRWNEPVLADPVREIQVREVPAQAIPVREREIPMPHSPLLHELQGAQWAPRVNLVRIDTAMSERSSSSKGTEILAPALSHINRRPEESAIQTKSRSRALLGKFGRERNNGRH